MARSCLPPGYATSRAALSLPLSASPPSFPSFLQSLHADWTPLVWGQLTGPPHNHLWANTAAGIGSAPNFMVQMCLVAHVQIWWANASNMHPHNTIFGLCPNLPRPSVAQKKQLECTSKFQIFWGWLKGNLEDLCCFEMVAVWGSAQPACLLPAQPADL